MGSGGVPWGLAAEGFHCRGFHEVSIASIAAVSIAAPPGLVESARVPPPYQPLPDDTRPYHSPPDTSVDFTDEWGSGWGLDTPRIRPQHRTEIGKRLVWQGLVGSSTVWEGLVGSGGFWSGRGCRVW